MPGGGTWLAERLLDLADTPGPDFDQARYWQRLVDLVYRQIVEPGVWVVVLGNRTMPTVVSAGVDQRLDRLAVLEEQAEAGPGVECALTGHQLVNVELAAAAGRWPVFAPMASELGFDAAHSFPIGRDSIRVGSVTVLTERGRPLSGADVRVARTMADAATIGIVHHRTATELRQRADRLQRQQTAGIVSEQAKGMLAARLNLSIPDSFALLRRYASDHHRPVAEAASDLVGGRLITPDFLPTAQRLGINTDTAGR